MAGYPDEARPAAELRQRHAFPLSAVLLLLLTAAIALVWSHFKLLWFDELIEMYTDGVGSVREVLRIQRHYPISLDPALFHVLAHGSTRLLGVTAFGMRVPALFGFLLAQVCCYVVARRVAGSTAALLALALPAISGMLLYAVEARPYGLLYGLYGLSLVAYQAATRDAPGASGRGGWLAGLAVVIAAAINTHWFGILMLVPLCVAELVRTVQRRRLDWPLLTAGTLGATGIVLALPFHAGVARYGVHYYADNTVNLHTLTLCYRVLFFSDLQVGTLPQKLLMTAAIAMVVVTLMLVALQRRRGRIDLPAPELAMLCTLLVLPCFGYVVALVVTHTMSIRYVFAAGLALAILMGCAFGPLLRTVASRGLVAVVLFVALAGMGWFHISRERVKTAAIAEGMRFSPAVAAVLNDPPGAAIYMVNLFPGTLYERYTPDPAMRRRVTLLYSFQQELALRHRDTQALTASNMTHFTGFPLESYEVLRQRGGRAVFAISPDTWWDWSRDALQRDGATLRDIGPAFGGEVVEVTFTNPMGRAQ